MTKEEFTNEAHAIFSEYLKNVEFFIATIDSIQDTLGSGVDLMKSLYDEAEIGKDKEAEDIIKEGEEDLPKMLNDARNTIYTNAINILKETLKELEKANNELKNANIF